MGTKQSQFSPPPPQFGICPLCVVQSLMLALNTWKWYTYVLQLQMLFFFWKNVSTSMLHISTCTIFIPFYPFEEKVHELYDSDSGSGNPYLKFTLFTIILVTFKPSQHLIQNKYKKVCQKEILCFPLGFVQIWQLVLFSTTFVMFFLLPLRATF